MKKFQMSVVALVVALLVPSSTLAGGWDSAGSSKINRWDVDIGWYSAYAYSTGGDFLVCVSPANNYKVTYTLWEYDSPSYSKKVGTRTYAGSGCLAPFRDIGAYVDGNNNKAEFLISTTDPEGTGTAVFWD